MKTKLKINKLIYKYINNTNNNSNNSFNSKNNLRNPNKNIKILLKKIYLCKNKTNK